MFLFPTATPVPNYSVLGPLKLGNQKDEAPKEVCRDFHIKQGDSIIEPNM